PFDAPRIQANYLADEADVDVVLEGVRIFREVAAARAFDEFRGREHLPGRDVRSRDDLLKGIGQYAQSLYHPVGTCAMGHDAHSVVDERLRVRGVDGLRVVDASIMPIIIGGNTNAPTIM